MDYIEETKQIIKDVTYDLMIKKQLFVDEIEVNWKTKKYKPEDITLSRIVPVLTYSPRINSGAFFSLER